MEHSVLNTQQSRLANRSLYFVLGLFSVAQNLENQLLASAAEPAEEAAESSNRDFLYFTLGALALSSNLKAKVETERELIVVEEIPAASDVPDNLKNLLY